MSTTLKPKIEALGSWANENKVPLQIGAGMVLNAGGLIATIFSTKRIVETLHGREDLSFKEKLKLTWKYLIAPTALEGASTACLISAAKGHMKEVATLSTALSTVASAYGEYKDKVIETVGEKAEKGIEDSIVQDKINKSDACDDEDLIPGEGPEVFYDTVIDRYFKSSKDKILDVVYDLREAMINAEVRGEGKHMKMELNKFYRRLGLPVCEFGERNYICNYDTDACRLPFQVTFSACFRRDGERTCQGITYSYVPVGMLCIPERFKRN